MQKFNSIAKFIDVLEDIADNLEDSTTTPIQTSTDIVQSDFIDSLDMDEWEDIESIFSTARKIANIHHRDEYIYDNLLKLGYTPDEISEITEYAEVE